MIDRGIGRFYIRQAGRIERELGIVYPGGTDKDLIAFVKEHQRDLPEEENKGKKARWTKKKKKPVVTESKHERYTPLAEAKYKSGGKILRVRERN